MTEGMCGHCSTAWVLVDGKLPEHRVMGNNDGERCCGSGKVPNRLVVDNQLVDNPRKDA